MTNHTSIKLIAAGFAAFAVALGTAADVRENWTKMCARCHAADGSGDTKAGRKLKARDYTSAEVQAKMTDEEMLKAIVEGVKDEKGKERMQGYSEKLSEEESKDLVAYIRTMKK